MNSDSQSDHAAIERAARLEAMGLEIHSASLKEAQDNINTFYDNGGNRAMRRAAKRAEHKRSKS